MASGISSPWGQSLQNVAGLKPSLDFGNTHLTGQLSLTSTPPTFTPGGSMVSPMMNTQQGYYSAGFGKRGRTRRVCKMKIKIKD